MTKATERVKAKRIEQVCGMGRNVEVLPSNYVEQRILLAFHAVGLIKTVKDCIDTANCFSKSF